MLFICYVKCSTCKKAEKWLIEKGIEFEKRDIASENPDKDELMTWMEKSGLDFKKFFNTSGMKYRELGLKEKVPFMTKEEAADILSKDGMLVKRPLLIGDDFVLVGFNENQWKDKLV